MPRAVVTLYSDADRDKAMTWIARAPKGYRVEIKEPKRSHEQNALMWAMLSDIAAQKRHHGLKLPAEDWKTLFMDAFNRESRMVPNLDGNGFVNLGRSTSDLSKEEFTGLIEVIAAWGAREGVRFGDQEAA